LALRPLIRMAASSYARAASSAVSKVPSHTLLFLQTIHACICIFNTSWENRTKAAAVLQVRTNVSLRTQWDS
jgi:hypothetical protein